MKGGGGGVGDVECVLHGRVENEERWRGGGLLPSGEYYAEFNTWSFLDLSSIIIPVFLVGTRKGLNANEVVINVHLS